MVDLIETYRKNGFELAAKELPDYLPLLLEYLSQRAPDEARDWLGHVNHIVGLLAARAGERGSPYALLFTILTDLAAGDLNLGPLRQRASEEPRDDTVEVMDRLWEEEAVRFGGELATDDCSRPSVRPRSPPRSDGAAMNALDQLLFQLYPYIALAVLLIGSWARFDRSMYTWRTGSSQLLSDRGMRLGSNLFHVGVLAILGGHIVGLLTPHSVYSVVLSAPQKQLLAMLVGGIFGVVCFVGISILLVRRLGNPRVRATGTFGDTLVLVLLLLQLMLGMYSITISRHHMDGSVMILLGEWAQHIVTFRWGAADFIAGVPWVYKAHVLLGMTLFLIAPFTRLVHVWSIPVSYLWRPYQVVRRRPLPLRYGTRQ